MQGPSGDSAGPPSPPYLWAGRTSLHPNFDDLANELAKCVVSYQGKPFVSYTITDLEIN